MLFVALDFKNLFYLVGPCPSPLCFFLEGVGGIWKWGVTSLYNLSDFDVSDTI